MSSTYRLLCLSHDPAIWLDQEWHSGSGGREVSLAAALDPPAEHAGCDLVIGSYSYPLVEVCCPGRRLGCRHRDPSWVDARWLRLLHAARRVPDLTDECRRAETSCWPADRLARLRLELE